MDEYIKKQDALDGITAAALWGDPYGLPYETIKLLPAEKVVMERRGKWKSDGSCPFCGEFDYIDPAGSNFCHNCGAKMDGGETE